MRAQSERTARGFFAGGDFDSLGLRLLPLSCGDTAYVGDIVSRRRVSFSTISIVRYNDHLFDFRHTG